MAKKSSTNGNGHRLDEAMALLIQNQAAFVARMSASDERFARIERDMTAILQVLADQGRILQEHGRILDKHTEMLEKLPDMLAHIPEAVREKFGFQPKPGDVR